MKELFERSGQSPPPAPPRPATPAVRDADQLDPIRTAPDASDPHVRQRRDVFGGQPPSYYGDEDEQDGDLVAYEKEAEQEGMHHAPRVINSGHS